MKRNINYKTHNIYEDFINNIEKIETKGVSKYIQTASKEIRENLNFRKFKLKGRKWN